MKDPEIKTYGCRLNFYESEVIRKYAKDNNLQNHIFINSCAVTNKTIADLKNEIRKVKKENQMITKGIEVGHIFYFSDKYSKPMNCLIDDKNGLPLDVEKISSITFGLFF